MSSNRFYITTAIDYVNGPPHLGHAYEKIAADAIARYHRMRGSDVYFLTGLDEHGIKVEKTARAAGVEPQRYCDDIAEKFLGAWEALNVRYDDFIRTTQSRHKDTVQRIFVRLREQGDVYKKTYQGLYCTGCEAFYQERDLQEGNCPVHQRPTETVSEENYFFNVERYRDRLRELIRDTQFVQPAFRRQEVLNMLENFEDVSFSRESVKWGIPVPGEENQVIYVWLDALSNYITALEYGKENSLFDRYWPANLHLIGKDIIKFHCIIWPAILMALDLPLPQRVYAHGFVMMGNQKMGKSTGNVMGPMDFVEKYTADALRYYLLRDVTFGQDGEFSIESFEKRVDADLANNLGNALNRILPILEKQCEGLVPEPGDLSGIALLSDRADLLERVQAAMDELALHEAITAIWGAVDRVNAFINDQAPWSLAKQAAENPEAKAQLYRVLYASLETLRVVAILAAPFIPILAGKIWQQLGIEAPLENQRWEDLQSASLRPGTRTQRLGPIYPRVGSALAGDAKRK